MGPKTEALRAMREANFDKWKDGQPGPRPISDKHRARLAELDAQAKAAAAKVAAKPKPKPFIPIDDTMLVPTGSLTKKPKRKAGRHK